MRFVLDLICLEVSFCAQISTNLVDVAETSAMPRRCEGHVPLIDPDLPQADELLYLLVSLSRVTVFFGWLLIAFQIVAICLAFSGQFSYFGSGVWSGVLVSVRNHCRLKLRVEIRGDI